MTHRMIEIAIFAAVTFSALFFWTDILHRGFEFAIDYWVIIGLIPYYVFLCDRFQFGFNIFGGQMFIITQ